ncbi:MAG: EF-hand domain-containing protein [Phototrophicaceae bacterium]|jgi:Ca2+-binding EF-hand superfamily protein
MAMTELISKKMTVWFNMVDRDKDGFLTGHDFEMAQESWNSLFDHQSDSPLYQKISGYWLNMWEGLKQVDADQDGKVTLDEFLNAMDFARQDAGYADIVMGWAQTTIDAFDTDQDGAISLSEWKRIYEINGLSEELAERTFVILDGDGDGLLSPTEYLGRVNEFTFAEEIETPGNHFYGIIE